MLVSGQCRDAKERYHLQLGQDKVLKLILTKEAYEKFGIEGKKLDKMGRKFIVSLDLTSDSLLPGHKFRQRLLENASIFFKHSLIWQLVCTQLAWQGLRVLVNSDKYPTNHKDIIIDKRHLELEVPSLELDDNKLPLEDSLEELTLWMGSITSDANLLLRPPTRLDPFISVCKLPGDSPPLLLIHYSIISPNRLLNTKLYELIETVVSKTRTRVFISGNDDKDGTGFLMHVDEFLNFVYCNTINF